MVTVRLSGAAAVAVDGAETSNRAGRLTHAPCRFDQTSCTLNVEPPAFKSEREPHASATSSLFAASYQASGGASEKASPTPGSVTLSAISWPDTAVRLSNS